MRAVVMRNGKLLLEEMPVPEPGPGEVLVKTLACGICGSDLHALKFAEQLVESSRRSGGPFVMDLSRGIVMGHEFCAEIADYGPGVERRLKPGVRVAAMPTILRGGIAATIGYANDFPGGYGEYMVLTEKLLLEVPPELAIEHAALTEPMAVGLHAVRMARIGERDAPIVIGCGPVGLAVVAALKLSGARPIVAADFSPRRRELALKMGADAAIDPREHSPYQSWAEVAAGQRVESGPAPWPGPRFSRDAVVFECVGVPGMIEQVMSWAPRRAKIVVVGVCMERDRFEPVFGINKELNIQFVLAYSKAEFAETLRHIADGAIPAAPMITGKTGIRGVAQAFADLASPEHHAKILVEPWRD